MSQLIIVDTQIGGQPKRLAVEVSDIDLEEVQILLIRGGAKIIKVQDMDALLEETK